MKKIIKIISAACLSVCMCTAMISPAFAEGTKLGDTNGDNSVGMQDVVALQRHIADLEKLTDIAYIVADVNGDRNVNMQDVTLIQQYIAGIVPSLGSDVVDNNEIDFNDLLG